MQVGDQIGDFVDVIVNNVEGCQQVMVFYFKWIGMCWFILFNVIYGSWELVLFNNDWMLLCNECWCQKEVVLCMK